MEGLWGMGGQIGSYASTLAPYNASPILDGTDRNVLDTALGKRAEARLQTLSERASALLTENRTSVLAVGHALESHRTLSGQDITAIMNRELGPVVDGRPYGDPDFVAELEAYHASAMSIQSRSDSLPLPVPVRHPRPELTAIPNTTELHTDQGGNSSNS
jgi:hypothetical protein